MAPYAHSSLTIGLRLSLLEIKLCKLNNVQDDHPALSRFRSVFTNHYCQPVCGGKSEKVRQIDFTRTVGEEQNLTSHY